MSPVRILCCLLTLSGAPTLPAAVVTWGATGPQVVASSGDLAVRLYDGRVLAVKYTGTAELYGPRTGTWSRTGSLRTPRSAFTLTRLASGRVLVVGGTSASDSSVPLASSEIYDPMTGIWTASGNLVTPRRDHIAERLQNGTVLVAGGLATRQPDDETFIGFLAEAEIYDPKTGAWSSTASMNFARTRPTSVRLADGRVLVVGGYSGTSSGSLQPNSETYDSLTASWTPSANELPLPGVERFTLTRLIGGRVLLAGGIVLLEGFPAATPQLYDPLTDTWSPTGAMLVQRFGHGATMLRDGRVLVEGGADTDGTGLASAELYRPRTGTWTATTSMAHARFQHSATRLHDGAVLVAGGNAAGTCEIYRRRRHDE